METKFFALQVLSDAIRTRWKTLPREQREGVKSYIIKLVFKLSESDSVLHGNRVLVNKLDATLVQVGSQFLGFSHLFLPSCTDHQTGMAAQLAHFYYGYLRF